MIHFNTLLLLEHKKAIQLGTINFIIENEENPESHTFNLNPTTLIGKKYLG